MVDRVPNLFLVGAMRSGTTALHEALGAHVDIFMSSFKEPAYFADPVELAADSPIISKAGYAGDRARYLELFADAGSSRYAGESSTHYTKLPRITGIPERMAAMSPEARIVYLARDPVERTISHYRFAVARKYERRDCLAALQAEPFYCAVGDYAEQIRPYIDEFGADRVHLCVLEDLIADPRAELGELYAWLGVDPPANVPDLQRRNELAASIQQARGPGFLHDIGRSARYQRIAAGLVPAGARDRVRRWLNRSVAVDEVRTPAVLAYLRRVHRPQVAVLEHLFDRRFPGWTTVSAAD